MTWIPITDGMTIPNGKEVRPSPTGIGYEYNNDGDGVADQCGDPVAHYDATTNTLTWSCPLGDCRTVCDDVQEPTEGDKYRIYCYCQPEL